MAVPAGTVVLVDRRKHPDRQHWRCRALVLGQDELDDHRVRLATPTSSCWPPVRRLPARPPL